MTTIELWELIEQSCIRPRIITFDRYLFFSRKQNRGEAIEQYLSLLKELAAEKRSFADCTETVIRDVFITKFSDTEIQRHLLPKIQDPSATLKTAINFKICPQKQLTTNNAAQL